jgi:hypothetical protein
MTLEAIIPKVRRLPLLRGLSPLILLVVTLLGVMGCTETPEVGINSLYLGGECYLEISNDAVLRSMLEGDFSLEIWAAAGATTPSEPRAIIMFGNNEGGNEIGIYQAAYDSSGVLVYVDDNQFGYFSIGNLDWRRGNFHYLCLTHTGGLVTFYFDGRLVEGRLLPTLDLNLGSSNVLIGADFDPPGVNANVGNYWIGYFDEVRLWRRNLSSDEIQFKARHPEKLLQTYSTDDLALLTGLWRFNVEQSDVLADESKAGLVATLRGNVSNFQWSTRKSKAM